MLPVGAMVSFLEAGAVVFDKTTCAGASSAG
jgi:hypothetical protein